MRHPLTGRRVGGNDCSDHTSVVAPPWIFSPAGQRCSDGRRTLTVVLEPAANTAPGTSDALTVRAEAVGTPGIENFA